MKYFNAIRATTVLVYFIALTIFDPIGNHAQESVPSKARTPKIIVIPQQFLTQYQIASSRTTDARRAVEDSLAWKNYVIAQNQEQTTLVAIMGELNIKPMTDECIPVYLRDGKRTLEDGSPVTSATGKLDHFECPVKEEKKP